MQNHILFGVLLTLVVAMTLQPPQLCTCEEIIDALQDQPSEWEDGGGDKRGSRAQSMAFRHPIIEDKRYMRFGRRSPYDVADVDPEDFTDEEKRYMRFGKRYMRFGKRVNSRGESAFKPY